jgi:predicted small metal-binding protein
MRLGKEVTPMAKIMQCDCGHVVRGETDDELVANVQKHAREVHDMEVTREQVLAMAQQE